MSAHRRAPATAAPADPPRPVDLSVVVPILDERESLPALMDEIRVGCGALGLTWEVVFVDDGSTDGSGDLLATWAHEPGPVRLVQLRRNFGKSAALQAGFERSAGRLMVTLDGDGQDDPGEIAGLVRKLEEGYDLVGGWKRRRRDPLVKRLSSAFFNRVTARLSGMPLHDFNCGLKAYRAECARSLELYGERHRYVPLLADQRGWRVGEVPINHRARRHGRSKFGSERYVRGMLDLLTVLFIGRYQHRPLHLFGGVGLVLMLAGVAISAYLTVLKIGGAAIGRRPLLLLGVLLIVVGIQLLTLGLLGEMVAATRQDVHARHAGDALIRRVVDGPPDAPHAQPAEYTKTPTGAKPG